MSPNTGRYLEAAQLGARWLIEQQNEDGSFIQADCLIAMTDQQPEEKRFYFWMTPEGRLITEASPLNGNAPFVDATKIQQPYYRPGIAFLFLVRLYLATASNDYLEAAGRLFEFTLRCAEDRYSYPASGKGAVGAAIYYAITGDERARDAAIEYAEYEAGDQRPEGWWCNPHSDTMIVRLDHTAELAVWMSEIATYLGDGH